MKNASSLSVGSCFFGLFDQCLHERGEIAHANGSLTSPQRASGVANGTSVNFLLNLSKELRELARPGEA